MAELLADNYVVGPLLEFLNNTEVGSRKGAAEREMEWKKIGLKIRLSSF